MLVKTQNKDKSYIMYNISYPSLKRECLLCVWEYIHNTMVNKVNVEPSKNTSLTFLQHWCFSMGLKYQVNHLEREKRSKSTYEVSSSQTTNGYILLLLEFGSIKIMGMKSVIEYMIIDRLKKQSRANFL